MIGTTVGSYTITAQVSVGGMGTVYRAEHTLIGRIAAVKILHPELSGNRDIVNRFFNEAKATTTIKHPGIVEVFDFGYMPSGHAFLVMEFLDGAPLSHKITQKGTFLEPEAALLMRGVCSALAAAHAKGIVHRDLKPDNIFVIPDPDAATGERTKILDFGIAKLTDVGLAGTATKTGAVMGTPTYMSPEQCRGTGQVDHRADLYSIGCMLYELLSGRPPFTNPGAGELIGSHLFVEPDPLAAHARVTPEMDRLVMCLLKKRPEERVQTSVELAQLLVGIAQQHGWAAPTATDPLGRFSMPHIPAQLPTRPSLTPAGASMPGAPMPTPMGASMPGSSMPTPMGASMPGSSMPGAAMPGAAMPGAPMPTPMGGAMPRAAMPGAAMPTPLGAGPSARASTASNASNASSAPTAIADPKPTTLSGAASQTHPAQHRSKAGLVITLTAVGAIAAGAAVFFAVTRGGSNKDADTASEPSRSSHAASRGDKPTTPSGPSKSGDPTSKSADQTSTSANQTMKSADPTSTSAGQTSTSADPTSTSGSATTKSGDTAPVDTTATKSADATATKSADGTTTKSVDATATKADDAAKPTTATTKPTTATTKPTTATTKPTPTTATTKPTTATTKPTPATATTKPATATTKPATATTKPATATKPAKPAKPSKPKTGDLLETDIE